jgi:hypothetical protein
MKRCVVDNCPAHGWIDTADGLKCRKHADN